MKKRRRKTENGECRVCKRPGRAAAAGLTGCLLVGLTVMCHPMSVSANESITRENFDYVRYADDYQDLKDAFGYDAKALYDHYRTYGIAERRTAYSVVSAAEFDHVRYADDYQDLKEAFGYDAGALYSHYLNFGRAEGRIVYRTDGSVVEGAAGKQAEEDNAGGTEQAAAADTKTQNKIVTDDGWEWNEKWGMWVR